MTKRLSPKGRRAEASRGSAAASAFAAHSDVEAEEDPYPGLRYYLSGESDLFAGRDEDIKLFSAMLFKSRLLILHGPTGCGKSSFLRAGVKPHVADLGARAKLPGDAHTFEVMRSTERPLAEFLKYLADIVNSVDPKTRVSPLFGELKEEADWKALKALLKRPVEDVAYDAALAYDVYKEVVGAFEVRPVLVIDQGEEVFTLNDARNMTGWTDAEIARRKGETDAYFALLHRIAREGGGPLIVSLRTEYKGQFDDRISGPTGHPGALLKGFYLKTLDEAALREAILRPCMDPAVWEKKYKAGEFKRPRPPGKVRLIFTKGQAEFIASELLKKDAVPPGGVLPALQVACLRLYRQALQAAGQAGTFRVKRSTIKSLGSISDQVSEYLSESIEEACAQREVTYDTKETSFHQLLDHVHRALARTLVHEEPDGRAVSYHLTDDKFQGQITKELGSKSLTWSLVQGFLVKRGLLRDKKADDSSEVEKTWSLGHDSVALALHKWRLKYARDESAMMRMMMMGVASQPSTWTKADLYGSEAEAPQEITVRVPRDFLWDRQMPFFAHEKGFDTLLGFNIISDDTLDATSFKKDSPTTWPEILTRLRKKDDDSDRELNEREGLLVAAEWGAFPLILRDEILDTYDKKACENIGLVPTEYAWRWTDVAATNMNLGNGLIGPADLAIKPVSDTSDAQAVRGEIKTILDYVYENKSMIMPFDLRAKRLLLLAADLVYEHAKTREAVKKYLQDNVQATPAKKYSPRDPIVAHLMEVQNEEAAAEAEAKAEPAKEVIGQPDHFVVAGAFPRAMASQAGFVVYFGAKHVAAIAGREMELRKQKKGEISGRLRDLAAETQRITSHTLWQFSMPNAEWDFGSSRARTLRLAALAYYTTEYVRTSMDEFVMFLKGLTKTFLSKDPAGPNSLRGVELSRAQIRRAVQDCYNFVRFEEYANEVFDLDAPYAYWSDHSDFQTKSVAPAIYQELLSLRQKTLGHFEGCVGIISWLRYKNAYFPKEDKAVADAFRFKEMAWKHFRIFNFYDAERFMSRAAATLATRMDAILAPENRKQLDSWRDAKLDGGE